MLTLAWGACPARELDLVLTPAAQTKSVCRAAKRYLQSVEHKPIINIAVAAQCHTAAHTTHHNRVSTRGCDASQRSHHLSVRAQQPQRVQRRSMSEKGSGESLGSALFNTATRFSF